MITRAMVKLWGEQVGEVEWIEPSMVGLFRVDQKLVERNLELAPFTMPNAEARDHTFRFPELAREQAFNGLPGLLADVLPDKYGNKLITSWLTRNDRQQGRINPVEKLCFIGSRGMGALEFEPDSFLPNTQSTPLDVKDVLMNVDQILSGKKDLSEHLNESEEKNIIDVLMVATSAGGARAKAIIAFNETTGDMATGQAEAPDGFEHWLIKFDGIMDGQFGASNGYGKVEMAYYLMTKDAGIDMMPSRILKENGRSHFMTKRFDRKDGNQKLHMQSFCAIQHFDFNEIGYYSYEQLFETMRSMNLPYDQHEQLYRRMVFNVLARNCDDHTKNFSFLMDKDGRWNLSPAYDMCHAYRPNSPWVSQHCMMINGIRQNISRKDLLSVAVNVDIKNADSIVDQVAEVVAKWESYAAQTEVNEELKDAIGQTLLPGFDEFKPMGNRKR